MPRKSSISTRQNQIEAALRVSEERFAAIFDCSPVPKSITRLSDNRLIDVNRAWLDLWGFEKQEVIHKTALEIGLWVNPEDRKRMMDELSKTGQVADFEARLRSRTRGERIVLISAHQAAIDGEDCLILQTSSIAERHALEEALRIKDWAIASSPSGIALLTLDGSFTSVNDAFVKLWGYDSPAEFIGRHMSEFPEFGASASSVSPDVLANVPWSGEFDLRRRGGQRVNVAVTISIVTGAADLPIAVMAILDDITEHKRAEEKLRESEEQYRFLLNNTTDFIARFDRNGVMVFGTDASRRFHGYEPDEIIGTSAFERVHPEDRARARAEFQRVIASGSEGRLEYRLKRKNGDDMWVEATGRRVSNALGEPELVVVQRDVSERKAAEMKLKASEEKYRLITESVDDIVWSVDREMRITYASPAARHVLGYAQEDVLGVKVNDLLDQASIAQMAEALKTRAGQKVSTGITTEYKIKHKGGHWVDIEVVSSPTCAEDGSMTGYVGVARDISKRIQAEEKLREAERKYRLLVEQSPVVVYIDEVGDHWQYLSPQVEKLLGITAEELISSYGMYSKRIHPDDAALVYAKTWEGIQQQQRILLEYRILNREDQYIWVRDEADARTDPVSGRIFLHGVFYDITERKRAENDLREAHRKYSIVADNTEAWEFWLDPHKEYVYISPSCERITGYPSHEFIQDPHFLNRIIHPEDLPVYQEHINHLVESPKAERLEFRIRHRDGTWLWIEHTCKPIFSEDDQYLGTRGSHRNITESKHAEAELEKRAAQMTLINQVGQKIASVLDIQGIFDLSARLVVEAFGYYHVALFIQDRDNGDFVMRSKSGQFAHIFPEGHRIKSGCGMVGVAGSSGQMLLANRVSENTAYINYFPELVTTASELSLPIKVASEVLGVLDVQSPEADTFHSNDIQVLEILADQIAVAIKNAQLYESVQKELAERKRAQERIHMQTVALESAANGIVITDMKGTILWVNAAWRTLTGYSSEEAVGQNPRILKSGKHGRDFYRNMWRTILSGNTWRSEMVNRRKDGLLYDEETTITPVRNEAGKITHFIGIKLDITERKRAERVMQARLRLASSSVHSNIEEFLRARLDEAEALTESSVGFFHFVENDQQTISLQTWSTNTLTNMCKAEGKGAHYPVEQAGIWVEAIKDKAPRIYNDYASAPNKKGLPKDHARVMRFIAIPLIRDGSVVALLGVGNKASDYTQHDVEIVTQLVSEAWDIILRKRAEEALQKMNAELELRIQQRTAEVRDLYENAPAGYHSVDAAGKIVAINQTELNWLGYARQEVLGQPLANFLTFASQHSFDAHFPIFKTSGLVNNLELEFVRKDGSTFPALVNSTAIYDEQGNFLMSRSTIFDNTERKKAEDALRESEAQLRISRDKLSAANAALEKAARMKDEFLASMSHELRTPLTGILGLTEVMQMNVYGTLTERQGKALKNIDESGRHLLALINDILDLSKIEAGMLELNIEPVALAEICQDSLQLTKGLAHKKRQAVDFSIEPDTIEVRGDARRLKQMLVNLLSNAIKFTPEKGSLGLEVRADQTEQTVRLTVWDRGIGIDPENLKKLFQPFVQLESSLARQYEGTGLGLSLVQHMAELHGGSVQVESTPGEGSRFTILLPWAPDAAALPTLSSSQEAILLNKALIIEDREIDAGQLAHYLRILGIETTIHTTGQGAVYLATQAKPDVILLDLGLPDQYGLDVLAEFKANPNSRNIPVIICSVEEKRSQAVSLGAAGYLVKPVTITDLRNELMRVASAVAQSVGAGLAAGPTEPTILVVDDNEMAIEVLHDFLGSQNFQVVAARSGMEALNVVPDIHPDIILMDIQMPGMDGLETTRRIRSHPDALIARIPVIALTGLAMRGDRERCLAAGANDYMSKPVILKQLAETIRALLEKE